MERLGLVTLSLASSIVAKTFYCVIVSVPSLIFIENKTLSHMGQSSNLGYHVVDLPPPSIVSLLANDFVRMTTTRPIPV
ncbi:unnamed protein product [Prunus armeniaca]